MNISFTQPLSRAWKRMIAALFKPFDISVWFIVGFTAFLYGLTDSPFPGSGINIDDNDIQDIREFVDVPQTVWEWFQSNPFWGYVIVLGAVLLISIVLVLTWLSSRGAFMFLDNVVHRRAQVAKPWNEFRKQGNSLFIFRILFGIVVIFSFILIAALIILAVILMATETFTEFPIFLIIALGLFSLGIIVVVMYISMFLNNFVVPIMYQRSLLVLEGWRIFIKLYKQHISDFVIYGIFLFILYIGLFMGILLAGILTCCMGFLILIIPYLNAVLLLPISYTLRAYSIEFLEQFGPEFEIFPKMITDQTEPVTKQNE